MSASTIEQTVLSDTTIFQGWFVDCTLDRVRVEKGSVSGTTLRETKIDGLEVRDVGVEHEDKFPNEHRGLVSDQENLCELLAELKFIPEREL